MKSRPTGPNQEILSSHGNDRRDDTRAASFLLTHQQLGAIALPTNPSNSQTLTLTINGTAIAVTFVTSIGSAANNVLIGASAAATTQNLVNFLRRPDLTSATQIAATAGNQTLIQYCGYAWPGSSTNIVPFSLNKNVNGLTGLLTSFTASTTATSGSWTAQTMQLYVEDGTYYIAGTRYLFTGGSTPTVTAPVSHPRIDVLTINSSGTLAWTTGTESVTPSAPAYPVGNVAICELYNVVSETALYDNENQQGGEGYISNDVRPVFGNAYGQFILDPGSEAQGDVLYYNGSNWARLAAGTSGEFLKTNGSGANPSWAGIQVGATDGTESNQLLTATGTLQTTNLTVTHGLGRTPAMINLSCLLTAASTPSSAFLNAQLSMSFDSSGNAIAGIAIVYFPNNSNAISSFNGPANPFSIQSAGATDAVSVSVGVTSIGSSTFTVQIKWQLTTGSGSFSGSEVSQIIWSVIG